MKSKHEKSHSPLCSDAQTKMKKVKDLHTLKAIVILSWKCRCVCVCEQRQWVSKQQQVLCVHTAARTCAYIQ